MTARTFADFRISVPSNAAGEVYTTCPECSSQRKKKTARCLSVNVDKGVWLCHHCGWTGTLLAGSQRATGSHWARPAYRKPEPPALETSGSSEKFLAFFSSRGIPRDVVERNRVERVRVYMPQREEFVTAIAFPYYRNGELVNVKYRDAEKNFRQEAGAEQILFGLDDVEDGDLWVWVEGELDKMSAEVAGFRNCVSVPNGAPSPNAKEYASKFDFLDADAERIGRASRHVIAVDNDAPGKALERELVRRLGAEKCYLAVWPEGCKDANDVLVRLGAEALASCISNAKPLPVEGAVDIVDKFDAVFRLYENGLEPGLSTGWPSLDEFYRVKPGEMSVVTGIPNSGKSNLLDAMLVNLAKLHGWSFALFSPENQPVEAHIARLAEKYATKPFTKGPSARITPDELTDTVLALNERFTIILPPVAELSTLDGILGIARSLVLRKGIKGLVIDPWNELEHDRPPAMSETEYISVCLGKVRKFGRAHGVHVWLVAHPAKLAKDRDGNYPIPTPYDISGSAHWRNKADNCLTVWRAFDNASDSVEIHIQKIRFRENGRLGMAALRFDKVCGAYIDPLNGAYCA